MFTSNELRWFYPGRIPEDIEVWFRQSCLIDQMQLPEAREDWYLYTPKCDFLGIKLRQGRLEAKWRQAEFGVVHFGEFVEGKAEKWGKWLCNDPTGESFQPATFLRTSSWINVQKVRNNQLYQVLPDYSTQPVTTKEHIDNGCSLEITHLISQDHIWWSLAFEAFGEDDRLIGNLEAVASRVFNTYRGPKLQVEDSYAYPHWLGLVLQ